MQKFYVVLLLLLTLIGFSAGATLPAGSQVAWKSGSVLASGKWVKIKTTGRGIYRIPFDKLKSWGFSSPELVNVYGGPCFKLPEQLSEEPMDDLVRNRAWRGKDGTGKECLFFYSAGNVSWKWDNGARIFRHTVNPYGEECHYYLSQEGNAAYGVAMGVQPAAPANKQVNSFDDYTRYEKEQYNVIKSGQQWFGDKFLNGISRTFAFSCDNPVQGRNATFLVSAIGRSSALSSLEVTINQVKQTAITFSTVNLDDATTLFADERQRTFSVALPAATEVISLSYSASNSLSEAYLDYVTVNWRRRLSLIGDELHFRDTESVGPGNMAQFTLENGAGAKVFDVTNPASLIEIPVSEQGGGITFRQQAEVLREYLAFKPGGNFPEPVFAGEVPNQNLHGMAVPELVIIVHPDFRQQAVRVADFHRQYDGMEVGIVTTNQVYNEFGSGVADATAIRNFLRMLYDRGGKLKYVLLFGDGSYDNRNLTGVKKAFIPTYQSENSLLPTSSFVSDDYFVILEQGESIYAGNIDLGIGRLPVSSAYEAQIVAEKIVDYHAPEAMGLWRSNLCFIGDDEDANLHVSDSETLANLVNAGHRAFQTNKVYFDAYPQQVTTGGERYPGVTEAINQQVKKGVLILNYVGHANDRFLADERVLDVSVINSWTNRNNLPIFVTATCEFSRFDAGETSAGESILLNPNGGGIGLFSTTRVVYAYSNFLLSKSFYQIAFEKDADGQNYRMGDIMRLAKNNTQSTLNTRNFSLLADPALRLSYPRYQVVTNSVNQKVAASAADTLKALSKVTVTGEIAGADGQRINGFNGQISAVVYDKAVMQKTLGNSGEAPFTYKVQNNIIYRGEATVTAGTFTFSFVIPKDISYNLGNGKIIYYAQNGMTDAHGAYENFIIGGSDQSQMADTKGPEVKLYLDNSQFRDGGKTSQNPLMLAEVFDESGINTVGAGIGHDIVAVLDGDYANAFVLNDYFKAAKDDYMRGLIEFPLRNLTEGEHTLLLKVWDSANNSTEVLLRFIVTGDFYMNEISNHPNPVTLYTDFVFSHNQPDATFKTLLEIFDISGTRVDYLQTTVSSDGERSNPVRWNPVERGIALRSGMYLYRITILSQQGKVTSKAGKMIISR